MDNDPGRPDRQMRDQVNDVLRRVEDMGDRQAAAELWRAGVPLRVICRVLREPKARRRRSA